MSKIIAIASGKGGVGKTTAAINLATAFADLGKDVVVVDANLEAPDISLYLGAPHVPVTLHSVMKGEKSLADAIYSHPSGIKVLPASTSLIEFKEAAYMDPVHTLRKLKKIGEIIILDCADGIGKSAMYALEVADEIIAVTTPDSPAVTNTIKMISLAEERGLVVVGAIINNIRGEKSAELNNQKIEKMLGKHILANIPHNKDVRESVGLKNPVVYTHPMSAVSITYKQLATDLAGDKYHQIRKKQGVFNSLLRRLWKK